MTRTPKYIALVAILVTACAGDDKPEPLAVVPDISVNDHMMSVVTPATDTIWGIEDPQSDAEWQVIDTAAVDIIAAFEAMKLGGSGENDIAWAANEDWDAMMDEAIEAALLARAAVLNRDVDGVLAAGNVLYPPCENCHLKYHPRVAGQ